jgi:tetratricopeptide (TPR) repeat protein
MRRLLVGISLLVTAAVPAAAQMGKQIVLQVGSPQDKAVTAIQSTADLHQRLALLNKFAATYPTGDMSLMADNLYVSVYSSLKDYAQAYSYGDKALSLDPNDLNVAVQLIRDAQLQSNTARMVSYAVRVGQMIARYKSQPAPAGMPASQWSQQQQQTLASIQPQISWVISATNYAISTESASTKSAMLAAMAKAFPKAH